MRLLNGNLNSSAIGAATRKTLTLPHNALLSNGGQLVNFNDLSGWTVGRGSGAANTSEHRAGSQSYQITSGVGVSGYATLTISQAFGSNGPNRLRISFYVDSPTANYSASQVIVVTLSSVSNLAKFFQYKKYSATVHQGLNTVDIYPEDWYNWNSESWANTMIRLRLETTPLAGDTVAISFDEIRLNPVMTPAVALSFDSGYASQWDAFNYLQPLGLCGTCYLRPTALDSAGYLTSSQAHVMEDAGWTMGIYPDNGYNLTLYPHDAVVGYLTATRAAMAAKGFTKSTMFLAYPFGNSNDISIQACIDAGILTGRNTQGRSLPYDHPPLLAEQNYNLVRGPEFYNGISLADAITYTDLAYTTGRIFPAYNHKLGVSAASDTWALADFEAWIDHCVELGMPFVTNETMYLLQRGPTTFAV